MKAHEIVPGLKLPAGMLGIVLHFNRKPFAHSFLSVWYTNAYHHNRKLSANSFLPVWLANVYHFNRKPFANSFLSVWLANVYHFNRKPFANSFLSARLIKVLHIHRKPFANSFLSVWSTIVSRRPVISSVAKRSREISGRIVSCRYGRPMCLNFIGNPSLIVSCRYG